MSWSKRVTEGLQLMQAALDAGERVPAGFLPQEHDDQVQKEGKAVKYLAWKKSLETRPVGRPAKPDGERLRNQINLGVSDGMLEKIQKRADAEHKSVTNWVRGILGHELAR